MEFNSGFNNTWNLNKARADKMPKPCRCGAQQNLWIHLPLGHTHIIEVKCGICERHLKWANKAQLQYGRTHGFVYREQQHGLPEERYTLAALLEA
jgi:hypothetical protein